MPQPPATATVGSSRAATVGVTMSPRRFDAGVEEDDDGPGRAAQADVRRRRVAEALARPDDLGVGRRRSPRAPRARPPAPATGRRRRSRPRSRRASLRAAPRGLARGHPASPWRSARPWPGPSTARRTATGRSRSTRSGSVLRRPGRAARPASARSRCHGPRSSSRRPRSRRAGDPPPASRRPPAPRLGRGRPTGPRPGSAGGVTWRRPATHG